ncbi:hypothetical protein Q7C36_014745 [Tachysurus vachellii]|uniref:Ig-like domain-containing protein n=1 Tax=Tachysurus vachellii TaxID=175792 RepID=A0AA88SEB8_TACVA|nr:hypothetical protein Q7C36_014745 [Tachysurus vachellii]
MSLLYISILWVCACVDSAEPNVTVSAPVGSTVILPCKVTGLSAQSTHFRWSTGYVIVFERSMYGSRVSSGYEGRVDVPVDALRKGNCSLVLKDVRITDDRFYKTFSVELRYNRRPNIWREINRVDLSVDVVWNITAQEGSTAVLPCKWSDLPVQTPHVQWFIDSEIVFERKGKESFDGEGYEGRVDVPEDELLKGNCSLVLKNVSVTDAAVYRSSLLVKNKEETRLVQTVTFSVDVKPQKKEDVTPAPSGEAGINCPQPLILIMSFLMCLLFAR